MIKIATVKCLWKCNRRVSWRTKLCVCLNIKMYIIKYLWNRCRALWVNCAQSINACPYRPFGGFISSWVFAMMNVNNIIPMGFPLQRHIILLFVCVCDQSFKLVNPFWDNMKLIKLMYFRACLNLWLYPGICLFFAIAVCKYGIRKFKSIKLIINWFWFSKKRKYIKTIIILVNG